MANMYKKGDKDTRAWGNYEVLEVGEHYAVKVINVKPKQKLSLQSHKNRAEHWTVVSGLATVTLGEKQIVAPEDMHIYIEKEQKHRLENNTDKELSLIEVQIGANLDENDIVRYSDIYGRV